MVTSQLIQGSGQFQSTPNPDALQATRAYTAPLPFQRKGLQDVKSAWGYSMDQRMDLMYGQCRLCRAVDGAQDCHEGNQTIMDVLGTLQFQSVDYHGSQLATAFADPEGAAPQDSSQYPLTEGGRYKPLPTEAWTVHGYTGLSISASTQLHPYSFQSQYTPQDWDALLKDGMARLLAGRQHQLSMRVLGNKPRLYCGSSAARRVSVGGADCGLVINSDRSIKTQGVGQSCYKAKKALIELCDNEFRLTAIPVLLTERVDGKLSDDFLSRKGGFVWFIRADGTVCYADGPEPAADSCAKEADFSRLEDLSAKIQPLGRTP